MFTFKQGTDTREVKKCVTKARKTIQRLKDSCGTAVRERDPRSGARNTQWRSHTLHSPSIINERPGQSLGQKMRIVYDCCAKANSQVPSLITVWKWDLLHSV